MRFASTLLLASTVAAALFPLLLTDASADADADADAKIRSRHLTRRNLDNENENENADAESRRLKSIFDRRAHSPQRSTSTIIQPRKHGKPTGEEDGGYLIGHGFIDGLNRAGAGVPKRTKAPKATKATKASTAGVTHAPASAPSASSSLAPTKTKRSKGGGDTKAPSASKTSKGACVPRGSKVSREFFMELFVMYVCMFCVSLYSSVRSILLAHFVRAPKATSKASSKTSPRDSDCDGLTDQEEKELGTDPFDADSDNDGVSTPAIIYIHISCDASVCES